jgi:Yip1-like protein
MNLIDRVKKILLTPAQEWAVIKSENIPVAEMFTQYVMILAAIPAVAGFIGFTLVGTSAWGIHVKPTLAEGLVFAALTYALSLASVYVLALIIDTLAPTFGCRKDFPTSLKVVVFSFTASWVAGIFQILPGLSWLSILGLYSLYLMYIGLQTLKEVPQDKLVGYFAVSLVAAVLIWIVVGTAINLIALGA